MMMRPPTGKRDLVAMVFENFGITRTLESLPKQKVLIVLNYHRIGNAGDSAYDPWVFSATADEFERQLVYLKRRFHMTTLDEAVAMARGDTPLRRSVLITFDDGYLDNYRVAFPALRSHGIQGVFFLPTSFIGTNHVPWWDKIAYILKKSRNNRIRLEYPERVEFDVPRTGVDHVIAKTLQLYKKPSMKLPDRFIRDLETACEISATSPTAERCFINWQEAREMQDFGMAFGSHTHTHAILSKLSVERQYDEARVSREVLQLQLKRNICALAYPVGGRSTFTLETVDVIKSSGYRAAFSFYGGFNVQGKVEPFNICRVDVAPHRHNRFRLKMALAGFTGRHWF
jgi:peptidoglycan/xylan/chitin deacetylase (PgdA/CDA1 family)